MFATSVSGTPTTAAITIGTQRISSRVTSSDVNANQPPTTKTTVATPKDALRSLRGVRRVRAVEAAQAPARENRGLVRHGRLASWPWSHSARRRSGRSSPGRRVEGEDLVLVHGRVLLHELARVGRSLADEHPLRIPAVEDGLELCRVLRVEERLRVKPALAWWFTVVCPRGRRPRRRCRPALRVSR